MHFVCTTKAAAGVMTRAPSPALRPKTCAQQDFPNGSRDSVLEIFGVFFSGFVLLASDIPGTKAN